MLIEDDERAMRTILRRTLEAEDFQVERRAGAETEIVRARAGLSKLALALEASRTTRVQPVDLVIAARELRRAAEG